MTRPITSEIELLRASLKGSSDAFEAIVKKYQSLICAITYSATGDLDRSEELAQQAFVNAWKNLAQLNDLASFRTWLCSIARSVIRNYLRSQRRDIISRAAPIEKVAPEVSGQFEPVETVISREQQEVIRQALQQIPESYREPLVLFYREQKSLKQVAEQLELSEGAARQRISRGRGMLREQVAAMVETTISRNGPTAAFTAAVVASIGAMAVGTSSAAAATASTTGVSGTGAAAATAASGLTAKIIAVAAVLTIGTAAVVTYTHVTSKAEQPESADAVPTIAQPETSARPPGIDTGTDITSDDIPAQSKTTTAAETISPPRNTDIIPTPAETETKEFFFKPEGAHSGRLKPWEAAYYKARIERIRRCWRRTAKKAGFHRDGRVNEPYPTYLVIDSIKPAMWLETAGQVDPNHYTELPRDMKWKLYRTSPDGNEDLGPVIRLKIRGLRTGHIFPEKVCIHGYGRGPGHFSIYITAPNVSTNYGSGTFVIETYKGQFTEGVDYFDSISVGEEEYVDSLDSAKGLANEIAQLKSEVDSELPRNLANWLGVEKQLYMQIERQLLMAGLEVINIRITAGPDCTAGHAEVNVCEDTAFDKGPRRSGPPRRVYLKIDHLGEDVWYLRSAASPEKGLKSVMRLDEPLELEFLVTAAGPLPEDESQPWLEKGRSIQPVVVKTDLAYRATLPNGVTVELFGICSNPSAGRQWWGPDGSLLEHSPYESAGAHGRAGEDVEMYEMAWRISGGRRISTTSVVTGDPPISTRSVTIEGRRVRQGMEGAQASYEVIDRYGHELRDVEAYGYTFENDRRKTTWKVGVGAADDELQWVEFRNISLVPGENFGFEIVKGVSISE